MTTTITRQATDDEQFPAAQSPPAALSAGDIARHLDGNLLFRRAFDDAMIGMALATIDGRWLSANRACCAMLGYSEAELLVSSYQALTHPDDLAPEGEQVRRMLAGECDHAQYEKRYLHKDGHVVWTLLSVSLLRDQQGRPLYFLSQKHDISAQKQADTVLRESEQRFRNAFDHGSIGMALAAPDGRWLKVNGALCAIFGYSEEELLAVDYQSLTHPDDHAYDELQVARLMNREVEFLQYEKRYIHKSGRVIPSLLNCSFVRDEHGAPLYYVSQVQDITERKAAEEAMLALNRRLAQSNRELQDFASVASHDLQEPLRKIQAFGDRLRVRHAAALDAQGHDYLARILAAAQRMQALINDLLAFSRVSSQGQPFMPVDLRVLAAEVVSDLETQIERTGGQVEILALPTVAGDPLQLRQLFQNLISNALKFHRPEVPPLVRLMAAPGLRGQHSILVEDNGIGFDEKYLDRIFTVFQRLHGREQYEGTGIGLAICRRIVERHGGTLGARSALGKGATFIITLPVSQP